MTTTDANGIVFLEGDDPVTPLQTTINLLAASVSEAITDLSNQSRKGTAITVPMTNTDDFENYTPGEPIKAIRMGNIVEISGTLRVMTAGLLSGTTTAIFGTLPAGYRPHPALFGRGYRQQGSGNNTWYLAISTSGVLSAARYGPGSTTVNTWLPFNTTFTTNDNWPGA